MKSAIFYSSLDRPVKKQRGDQCFEILILDKDAGEYTPVFIRAEVVESDDLNALDMAKPRSTETVLNSIEL